MSMLDVKTFTGNLGPSMLILSNVAVKLKYSFIICPLCRNKLLKKMFYCISMLINSCTL